GCLLEFDIAGTGLQVCRAVDTSGANGTGAGLCFEGGAYVLNINISGASAGANAGGTGKSDVIIDADIAEEIVGMGLADGDGVAVLHDGGIAGDLLNSGFAVAVDP